MLPPLHATEGRISMSNIKSVFEHKKAFIPFVTAGDPDLETSEKLIEQMSKSGADIIEIGIPFSDPIAEGAVIQQADLRAISAGTTTDKIFEMASRIGSKVECPLVLVTYMNPIFVYGTDRFMKRCSECNISGVIVPDTPFEEKEELAPFCEKYGVELISFASCASDSRVKMIAKQAHGFLYCVGSENKSVSDAVSVAKSVSDIPCVVALEDATAEQASVASIYADGVVCDTAVVKLIEKYGRDCQSPVCEFIKSMKLAING